MALSKLVSKKVEAETVLGVDASTNSFAFCLYGKNGPIKWGEIHFKGDNVFERLAYGQRNIAAMKDHLKADIVIFESAIYVQNKKTVILLAYAFGAVISALINNGAKIEEVSPLGWQNYIGKKPLNKAEKESIKKDFPNKSTSWYSNKNRETRKARTMQWAEDEFGIKVDSDNVSDAIGVAHYGFKKYVLTDD